MHRKDPRILLVAATLVLASLSILPFDDAGAPRASVEAMLTAVKVTSKATTTVPAQAGAKARGKTQRKARAKTQGKTRRTCRSGSITLTFDDGPSPVMTPRLVRVLVREQVPATFFMVGEKVRRSPAVARLVRDQGFTIGNHTWSHPDLTRLSSRRVRGQVLKAGAELRRQGIRTGRLMRPPYGAISGRVSREIRRMGLVPVLWTADSLDWSGGSAPQIARRILAQLRRYRTNVVLQHDGVGNSAASVAAVPILVRAARARGYCFTDLGPGGGVARARSTRVRAGDSATTARMSGPVAASWPVPQSR